MKRIFHSRTSLLVCTALVSAGGVVGTAEAQIAQQDTTAVQPSVASEAAETGGLADIVVTAQKRAQRLQDVPIAVTALTGDALQINRVVNVNDLSGLAPGVTVRPAAGGSQIPSFTIRGAVSYGVVPGSDKEISVYLDGVYISSPRGSIFDLPDVERIEVLRGPQGTLFGRNATAGAVSISTRDPSGKIGARVEGTVGNYDQRRLRISLDSPQFGAFSLYGSYVKNYKRGDIRNANAGQVWDLSNAPGFGVERSPKYLGTRDSDSFFAAVKFEPSDTFSTVYKFDHVVDHGTPEGTGFVGYNPSAPLIGSLIGALVNSQAGPVYIYPDGKRPKVVNNGFALHTDQKNYGHSLTSTFRASDNLTFKNIAAYRYNYIFASSPIDGFSSLTFTPQALVPYATFVAFSSLPPASAIAAIPTIAGQLAPLIGSPFVGIGTHPTSTGKQWSDELQANYDSQLLTLTAGALYFKSKDTQSGPFGLQNTYAFVVIPGGKFPIGNIGQSINNATSIAAYAQAEVHATSTIDVVLGARLTRDKKSGSFNYGNNPAALIAIPFDYKKTKPNYLVGVNYKPSRDLLVYAKFSTAFVSGGSVAGILFEPETATSYEAGVKASLFDRRVQTNLAVYHVTYKHFQTAQGSSNFKALLSNVNGRDLSNAISTFILDQGGPVKAKGVEFDVTAAPVRNVTLGGSLGYSDTKFYDVNPVLIAANGGFNEPTLRPHWTATTSAQYESEPMFGDARLLVRADANYRSKTRLDPNPARGIPAFSQVQFAPSQWIVNGRIALRNIDLGAVKTEFAIWGKNLTNNKSLNYALIQPFEASANYQAARTYGADLIVQF